KKSQQFGIKFSVHKRSPLLENLQKNLTTYAWGLIFAQTQANTSTYTYVKDTADVFPHHPEDQEDVSRQPKVPEKFPASSLQQKQKSKTTVIRSLHTVLTEVAEVVQVLPLPAMDSAIAL
ncbi:hypothetical protein OUZ56_032282, partial [Daphnia magna]